MTKLSTYHFVGTENFRERVIQMGEEPNRVFNVGDLAISNIKNTKLLSRKQLEKKLNIKLIENLILITYHPVTNEKGRNTFYLKELLKALSKIKNYQLIFTYPNIDSENLSLIRLIDEFIQINDNSYAFKSLGILKYLSLVSLCKTVIGNSSSGLIEVPEFSIPTINIGNRQMGRMQGNTIINCEAKYTTINKSINKALSNEFQEFVKSKGNNPYSTRNDTVKLIVGHIKKLLKNKNFSKSKEFYDLNKK